MPSGSSIPSWVARTLDACGGSYALRSLGDRCAIRRGGQWPPFRLRAGRPFQILIYHRVHQRVRPFMLDTVDTVRFEAQMRHLARHYRPVGLTDLLDHAERGTVPPRAVAVTFDDGYRDNHGCAFPILAKYRIPATVFLVTGCIGTGESLWHDRVLFAFEHTRKASLRVPGRDDPVDLQSAAARETVALQTLERFKRMDETKRRSSVQALFVELDVDPASMPSDLMLDWDEARQMAGAGIEIGSHTVTHPILSRQTPEQVEWELSESKRTLEAELGRKAALFAYPNGTPDDYTPSVIEAVRRTGYRCALTTSFGPNEAGDDPFLWRRGTPWEHDPARFSLKLALYRALEAGPA